MPLVEVSLEGTNESIVINTAHVVTARRIGPPVTEVTMIDGQVLRVVLSLSALATASKAA